MTRRQPGCQPPPRLLLAVLLLAALISGCGHRETAVPEPGGEETASLYRQLGLPENTPVEVVGWHEVPDLDEPVAQFKTVFWEPRDTTTLRRWIRESDWLQGKQVLEIGTGTGLLALCCLRAGAARVVATDVNPSAVANAWYNAQIHGFHDRLEVRWVRPGDTRAYAVIRPDEQFDLIVSNPPWEEGDPARVDDYALYDPEFALLRSMLEGMGRHLAPQGRALLAYGSVTAIRHVERLAPQCGLQVRRLDSRLLESLPEVFLPAMVLELTVSPPANSSTSRPLQTEPPRPGQQD